MNIQNIVKNNGKKADNFIKLIKKYLVVFNRKQKMIPVNNRFLILSTVSYYEA